MREKNVSIQDSFICHMEFLENVDKQGSYITSWRDEVTINVIITLLTNFAGGLHKIHIQGH